MQLRKLIYLSLLPVSVALADTPYSSHLTTPYGKLAITPDNTLTFRGVPVKPLVQGNSSLDLTYAFPTKGGQAVLLQDTGGSGCPALFRWIVVSAGGYKLSPEFGTCTDLIKVEAKGGRFIVRMPGFVGPFNTQAEQRQAVKRRVTFVYDGNTLIKHKQSAK